MHLSGKIVLLLKFKYQTKLDIAWLLWSTQKKDLDLDKVKRLLAFWMDFVKKAYR